MFRLQTMFDLAQSCLAELYPHSEDGFTWQEIYTQLGEAETAVQREVVGPYEVEPLNGRFMIWKRARHVFSEALRVYQFRDLLLSSVGEAGGLDKHLGQLMAQSQVSCRDDFDCSCPELNQMVDIGMSNGSLGTRLTGEPTAWSD